MQIATTANGRFGIDDSKQLIYNTGNRSIIAFGELSEPLQKEIVSAFAAGKTSLAFQHAMVELSDEFPHMKCAFFKCMKKGFVNVDTAPKFFCDMQECLRVVLTKSIKYQGKQAKALRGVCWERLDIILKLFHILESINFPITCLHSWLIFGLIWETNDKNVEVIFF
jgi:hypothetical protein